MTAIRMWLRAELRGRWRAWFGLALLIGVFGGTVLVCAAGARRTDTVYDRFLTWSRAYDAVTFYNAFDPSFASLDPDAVEALPAVSEHARGDFYATTDSTISVVAPADERFQRTFNRPLFLDGSSPDAADEVSIPFGVAEDRGLAVGDTIELSFIAGGSGRGSEELSPRTLRVAAIHVSPNPGEFPPSGSGERGLVLLSRAFSLANREVLFHFGTGFFRVHGGGDGIEEFREQIETVADGKPFFVLPQADQTAIADEAVHLVAVAMWGLGIVLALVVALVVAQTLARRFIMGGEDFPTARALGFTSGQLVSVGMVRAGVIGAGAALIGVIVAIAASPLTPIGIASVVESSRGVWIDAPALAIGAAAIFFAIVLLSLAPAWLAERINVARDQRAPRRARVGRWAFRLGLPVTAVAGIRLALEPGRGRTAVPTRSTLGAASVGIAALVAAFVFATSLDGLLVRPELYGIVWDREITVPDTMARERIAPEVERMTGEIAALPGVDTVGPADAGIPLTVAGVQVAGIGLDLDQHRALAPTLISGAYPDGRDEIAVGPKTFEASRLQLGERTQVGLPGVPSLPFTVVGTVASPGYDIGSAIGEGVLLDQSALGRFLPDPPPIGTMFVRFSADADVSRLDAELERIAGGVGSEVESPARPDQIANLGHVDEIPALMAGMLALLAMAAIAHGLASSVRRRARDLAIFRAIGFVRAQVRAAVAWQAVTFAVAAVLIGVPLGIGAGRWVWTLAARDLGVTAVPAVPLATIGAVAGGAVLLSLAVSAFPGRAAARVRPAAILRAE